MIQTKATDASFPTAEEGKKLSLADAAAQVAEASGPAIVRFVNNESSGKTPSMPARDTKRLMELFNVNNAANSDVCFAAKLFSLYTVDVSAVEEKNCPDANKSKAPVVAVLNAEGKVVATLGPGQIRKGELLAAMAKALQPKVNLEKILAGSKEIIQNAAKLQMLKKKLDATRAKLTSAKNGNPQIEAEIAKLTEDIQAASATLDEQGTKLYAGG